MGAFGDVVCEYCGERYYEEDTHTCRLSDIWSELESLRAQLAERERWIGGAHNDMARMTESLHTAKRSLAEANGTIADLQGVVAEGDRQLAAVISRAERAEENAAGRLLDLAVAHQQLAEREREVERLREAATYVVAELLHVYPQQKGRTKASISRQITRLELALENDDG